MLPEEPRLSNRSYVLPKNAWLLAAMASTSREVVLEGGRGGVGPSVCRSIEEDGGKPRSWPVDAEKGESRDQMVPQLEPLATYRAEHTSIVYFLNL